MRGRTKPRKKARKTTVGPQGLPIQASSPAKTAPRKKSTRPAPAVQPGPVRQTERDKADEFKKTAKYRGAVRAGYKEQPVKDRQARVKRARKVRTPEGDAILHTHDAEIARNAVLKAGRARSTGFTDAERRRVDRFKASDTYKDTIAKVSEDRGTTRKYEDMTTRQIDAERKNLRDKASIPGTTAGLGLIQGGSIKESPKGKLQPELDTPEPTAKDRAVKKVAAAAARAGADPEKVVAGINKSLEKNKSPALDVLEETQRPINAISGAVEAGVKGKSVPRAVKKGLVDNKGPGFQKLLKDAGLPKPVAAIGGFALDVGLDPTTYITFGTAGVARSVAVKEAERAAGKAAAQGLSKGTQERLARAAYRQAVKKQGGKALPVQTGPVKGTEGPRRLARKINAGTPVVGGRRGVSMRFAGKEVPGVRRATAAIPAKVRAVRRRGERFGLNDPIGSQAGREGARNVARQVRPQVRPKGVEREEFDLVRAEMRGGRAVRAQASAMGDRQAQAIIRELEGDPERYARVIDAIERGKLSKLPDADREIARQVRDFNRGQARKLRQAGVAMGDVRKKGSGRRSVLETEAANLRRVARKIDVPDRSAKPRRGTGRPADVLRYVDDVAINPLLAARVRASEAANELATVLSAERGASKAQGRAEVLSRNVSGARAERAAQRAENVRRPGTRGAPSDVLRWIDEAPKLAEQYAGGGAGVRAARESLDGRSASEALVELERAKTALRAASTSAAEKARARRAIDTAIARIETNVRNTRDYSRDYVRHQPAEPATATGSLGKRARKRSQEQSIQRERTDPRPISVQNAEKPNNPLSTDLPTLQGVAINRGGRALETARVGRALLDVGKPVTRAPDAGETVVRVVGQKIERASADDVDRLLDPKRKNPPTPGQYRTVNSDLLDDLESKLEAGVDTPGTLLKFPTKVTGGFKKLVYLNPAFHGRNAIGDLLVAYSETSPREIARGARSGVKVLRHVSSGERRQLKKVGGLADDGGRTVKVGGEELSLDDFANELMEQGIVRMNRAFEFDEMLRAGRVEPKVTKTAKLSDKLGGASYRRWLENREDLLRISTYKALRDRGLSKVDAGNMVSNVHIDYSELSKAERGIRATVAPFYTWSARQIPEQSKRLVTRPGKAANFEKARRNVAEATGGDQDELNEYERRSVPFVIGLPGGNNKVIQFGAPQTVLNETPQIQALGGNVADALIAQGDEWMKFGVSQLAPLWRVPVELTAGASTFFRAPIEPEYAPLRPAPTWALSLPAETQRVLGVTDQYYDRKTGKRVPGWRGTAGYLQQQVPGLIQTANKFMTPGEDKSKQSTAEKIIGLSGVQSRTSDTLENAMGRLFEEREKVKKRAGALNKQLAPQTRDALEQAKGTGDKLRRSKERAVARLPEPQRSIAREYVKANADVAEIETVISGLSRELGYERPFYEAKTAPKKARKKKAADPYGGSGTAPGYSSSTSAPGY